MPRHERRVRITVDPPDGRHLTATGGRFQQGLHVIVHADRLTAWIPQGGRTASGPPKFTDRIDRDFERTCVTGTIREARIDQFNAAFWAFPCVVALAMCVGGIVAEQQHQSGGLLVSVIGPVFAVLFATLSISGQRGRAETFDRRSRDLELVLRQWAGPPRSEARAWR